MRSWNAWRYSGRIKVLCNLLRNRGSVWAPGTWSVIRRVMKRMAVRHLDGHAAQGSCRAHMGSRHAGAAAPVGLALSLGRLWGAAVLSWGCAAQTGRCDVVKACPPGELGPP